MWISFWFEEIQNQYVDQIPVQKGEWILVFISEHVIYQQVLALKITLFCEFCW